MQGPGETTRWVGRGRLDLGDGHVVVALDGDVGAELAQELDEVVGERVVVVDHEDPGAVAGPGGDGRHDVPPSPNCSWARSMARSRAAALFLRLSVLLRGHRVGDDAGAGLHVGHAVLDDHRADADAGVEVAAVAEVADGAGVGAAAHRLELVDDLHGAHLGGAAHGAGGERRLERVGRVVALRQRAAHRRDHVDDVRVELHLHELVDLDGARARRRGRGRCGRGRRA